MHFEIYLETSIQRRFRFEFIRHSKKLQLQLTRERCKSSLGARIHQHLSHQAALMGPERDHAAV